MTGGWMTGGDWMTRGCWGAHPAASNIPPTISDRKFTLRSLAPLTRCARRRYRCGRFMMIDDDTLKQLLRINDELLRLCKFLNEKCNMRTSSRLIPLVDDLTHILIEAGKNKLQCSGSPFRPYLPPVIGGDCLVSNTREP
jgi:hypothetical protein